MREISSVENAGTQDFLKQGNFLAGISHEISTTMNSIQGLGDLLLLTPLSEQQKRYATDIIHASNSLLGIMFDVMNFSSLGGGLSLNLRSYNAAELAAEVGGLMGARAAEDGLDMFLEVSPNLPSLLTGDDYHIKQVIMNLLSNAVKYTPRGFVLLKMSGAERGGEFWLECQVEDSGRGIRESDIPGLFDGSKSDGVSGGAGLGLAISKSLITAMGGELTVKSVYGEGSVFTFRIPQKVADPTPLLRVEDAEKKHLLLLGKAPVTLSELGVTFTRVGSELELFSAELPAFTHCVYDETFHDESIKRLRESSQGAVFASLRGAHPSNGAQGAAELLAVFRIADILNTAVSPDKKTPRGVKNGEKADAEFPGTKVLVVDDNEVNNIVSSEMLRSVGATVDCADNGFTALEMCAETKYEIIFMDHIMPDMDGVETTRELRSQEGLNSETPIIALTANVLGNMRSAYLQCGMNDIISKPVDIKDITRVLRQWLTKERLTGSESV
jgi:CheY-like chemotaxis protein